MDQTAAEQVDIVVAVIREVLPDALLGVYLHGSAVSGTLRPTSDLDLLAVTSRRTTHAERRRLVERLLPVSGSGDPSGQSRSVDVEAVAQDDVRPWRYPARLDFQYGDWHRPAFARGDFAPWNPENPLLREEHRAVLAHARSLYVRGIAAEAWGDLMPRVRPLVDHLIGRIREAAGTTPA